MYGEESSMHGVILDLSRSMQTEIDGHAIKRGVMDIRAHAMLDAVTAIVQKESVRSANSKIFTVAYGVNYGHVQTVDLLSAGSALKGLDSGVGGAAVNAWTQAGMQPQSPPSTGNIAQGQVNLPCAGNSQKDQLAAAMGLSPEDPSLAEMISKNLNLGQNGSFNNRPDIEKQARIGNILAAHQNPKPRQMSEISRTQHAENVSTTLHGYLTTLEPYIYGEAAMCGALKLALNVFKRCRQKRKLLLIISGGQPEDGNPLDSGLIAQLKQGRVLIISCFISSNHIKNPREVFSEPQEQWSWPAKLMFQISSNVSNQKLPRSLLAARGWRLSQSGTSNLFLQANHPDVINEFTTLFMSLETNVDALVNILGQIKIDDILNTRLHELENQKREPQIGETCYAHSIATVIYLATKRIVGYDETRPSIEAYMKNAPLEFLTLLGHIIEEFGIHGANTQNVLQKVAPIFWFHTKQVSESQAREALNQQRPLVARFSLYGNQWDAFEKFWDGPNNKGIMHVYHLPVGDPNYPPSGHAVTLISIEGGALRLLNSWGSGWADRGFFRIADGSVLGMEFFDVYYDEENLTQSERNAWVNESKILAKDLSNFFPSCGEVLKYQCPKCMAMSFLKDFGGDFVEAQCPACKQMFATAGGNLEILQALYYRDN